MSDSVRPHRRQPIRLPRPWDSPGKNTGVGCHFLLQCMKVKSEGEVTQSCPTLATPWTAAYQAPLSMRFSRQKYWSGVPLPSLPDELRKVQNCVHLEQPTHPVASHSFLMDLFFGASHSTAVHSATKRSKIGPFVECGWT